MSAPAVLTSTLPPSDAWNNVVAASEAQGPSPDTPDIYSAPNFTFSGVPSLPACGTGSISWSYIGPPQNVSLFVAPTRSPADMSLVTYSCPAAAGSYSWASVNVTGGIYEMLALGDGLASLSFAFVVEGDSTSCLTQVPPSPTPPVTSTKQSHLGVFVGSAIGGVAVLAAILGACLYCSFRGKAVPGYRWRSFKDDGKDVQRRSCPGLSSYFNISSQRSAASPSEEAMAAVAGKDSVPLTMLPRLEPNRRKPSIATVTLLSEGLSKPEVERSLPPTPCPAVRLDDELPLPPASYVAPSPAIDRLRRSRTIDTFDSVSVIWLRRHSSVVPPTRRPSGTSAVPSSSTSQMYRGRDSMFSVATPRTPDVAERDSPDRPNSSRNARLLGHPPSMYETIPDVPPLPSGYI
ncbi:hypothetical protein OH77DRAFT_674283 [Trametes cingulata]|nr:hypothetical protein OH77DRAFT_674283 [Trametes cingulata]